MLKSDARITQLNQEAEDLTLVHDGLRSKVEKQEEVNCGTEFDWLDLLAIVFDWLGLLVISLVFLQHRKTIILRSGSCL